MAAEFPCTKCGIPSTNCCSKCHVVYYCSREHQKADWINHKLVCCSPFKIKESSSEGRFLVACRPIKAGELIMEEPPLVIGPKLLTTPLCLGCYKPVNGAYRCSRCNWPMCSRVCEDAISHRNNECKIVDPAAVVNSLRQDAINTQIYQFISPLRALLLPLSDRDRLHKLVSHIEERKHTAIYQLVEQNIASFLREKLKLTEFQSEDIQTVCGILDTNCFDIRFRDRVSFRGLYPTASLMNHECVANTRHVFTPNDWRIKVFATKDIPTGEQISANYSQSLWNTPSRRLHLNLTKHFWCSCRRCADPFELGTSLSALKCAKCGSLVHSSNSLDYNSTWECVECKTTIKAKEAIHIHETTRSELKMMAQQARGNPAILENFIKKCSMEIHPNSCHVYEAKFALIQLYGNTPKQLYQDLSQNQKQKKIDYCKELLKLADVIEPGLSQFRGNLLFELQAVLENYKNIHIKNDPATLKELTQIIEETFTSAAKILSYEVDWLKILEKRKLEISSRAK